MGDAFSLDPLLDLKAAVPLQSFLLLRRSTPLEIDASRVTRLGGLCLQVLLAAESTWRHDGVPFSIPAQSQAFRNDLRQFGAADRFDDPQASQTGAP
jgi:chemotaxis protein CheX